MTGKTTLTATEEQIEELRKLAKSRERGEADRARSVLLTVEGWTSAAIGRAFGVDEASVRHWRQWFADGGVPALVSTVAPGRSPEQGEKALAAITDLLEAPVQDRKNWTLARLCAEAEARGAPLSSSRLSVVLKKTTSLGAVLGIR
jgi:transposase